jgi:hypothetical protein
MSASGERSIVTGIPGFEDELPFVLADVAIDGTDDLRLIGRLVDGPDSALRLGAPVQVVFDQAWRPFFLERADKPGFFSEQRPLYRVIDEQQGLLLPQRGELEPGGVYFRGDAAQVSSTWACPRMRSSSRTTSTPTCVSKALRWRTALILRELEPEIEALEAFRPTEDALRALMTEKEDLERTLARTRLARQRARHRYARAGPEAAESEAEITRLQEALVALDDRIGPWPVPPGDQPVVGALARRPDKSLFARQVGATPMCTPRGSPTPLRRLRLPRAARSTLPHDPS